MGESSFNDVLIFEHLDASSVDTKFSKLMYSKTCDPAILEVPVIEDVVDEETPVAEEIPDVIICLMQRHLQMSYKMMPAIMYIYSIVIPDMIQSASLACTLVHT